MKRSRSGWLVCIGATAAAVLVTLQSCTAYRWAPIPLTDVALEREGLINRHVRVSTTEGYVEMALRSVAYPFLVGTSPRGGGMAAVEALAGAPIGIIGGARVQEELAYDSIRRNAGALVGRDVQVHTARGPVRLQRVTSVEFPRIHGHVMAGTGEVIVDLREASALRIREADIAASFIKTVFFTGALIGAVALVVALTKESCPFVYIDRGDGWELVGEAYAGAAFKSLQRDDMLPLPSIEGLDSVRIKLRNEARETQYTDQARLVVVDHDPDMRVLSTFDNRLLLAREPRLPAWVRHSRDVDIAAALAAADRKVAETDPTVLAGLRDDELEESILAGFEWPHGTAVLEIVAGNTAWLDLVFGRFFGSMGDRLEKYLAQGNDPGAGPALHAWRRREGVDLTIEIWTGGNWAEVATVTTAGPAALREIAIPLPTLGAPGETFTVRMRSGAGFWRFDSVALSALEPEAQRSIHYVEATAATNDHGADELDVLLGTDGRYNVLAAMNESVDLTFALPALASGRTRSGFLFTNGYYNVHPPIQAKWQPGNLRVIRDEPGSFARFGRDLARKYARVLEQSPQLTAAQLEALR